MNFGKTLHNIKIYFQDIQQCLSDVPIQTY